MVVRNPKHGDMKLKVMNNSKIGSLKETYQKQIKDSGVVSIRMFLNGRELLAEHSVFYYNLNGGEKIVHAFIRYE